MGWAVRAQPACGKARGSCLGFTLVELLVVLGIITVLLSLLLPALKAARRSSNAVQCSANVRALCMALLMYAQDNNSRFPPNTDTGIQPQYWYDTDRIGKYLTRTSTSAGTKSPLPPVFACPADPESARSYAMNLWASSKIDALKLSAKPTRGKPWNAKEKNPSKLILVTERWASTRASVTAPWLSPAYVGYAGTTPGQRFGAGGGLTTLVTTGRWGSANCELPYVRHRVGRAKTEKEPKGSIVIGYADGHVELKTESQLADFSTGLSTLDSLWSPLDNDPAFNK